MLVTAEAQPERQQSPRQAVRAAYNMDIFLHRHQPQHMSPFAGKPVNLKSCSVRFGCIHIPFLRLQFGRWINKSYSTQQMIFASDFLPVKRPRIPRRNFKLIHILKWWDAANGIDLSPVAVSYLLWGREAAPHWPGWMSTSWRTPPPRPRHSRSRSTGREEGHKPRRKGAERGPKSYQVLICGLAEVWCLYGERRVFQLTTTRWHWSAPFVKVTVFAGKKNMQCNMLYWDSLRPIIRQQTICGQW